VYSRQSLYLKPYIGAGITDLERNPFKESVFGRDMALAGGAELGLSGNSWHKNIGIGLLRTGFGNETSFYDKNGVLKNHDIRGRMNHILVPVKLGYEMHLGNMSLMPELGVAAGYLVGAINKIKDIETGEVVRHELKFANTELRKFSLFGTAGVNIAYHFNSHISLTLAPTYYLMVSNAYANRGGFLDYGASGHQYALTLNAGLVLKL
ncbi:MAG: hypothetical protein K8F30_10980, partial [Taibaiella sp.]|nr:hypothetical protein [Taibaiella sp.]